MKTDSGVCRELQPHRHIACPYCAWNGLRPLLIGAPTRTGLAWLELMEHVASSHWEDHPVRAVFARIGVTIWVRAEL